MREDRDDRDQYRCEHLFKKNNIFHASCFIDGDKKNVGAGEGFAPEFVSLFPFILFFLL